MDLKTDIRNIEYMLKWLSVKVDMCKSVVGFTYPSSIGLALVAESKDEDDGHDSKDNGEQDTHVVMWLKMEQILIIIQTASCS